VSGIEVATGIDAVSADLPGVGPTRSGPTLFARYAYPPNERGSCGPPQHRILFEYSIADSDDPGLLQLARQFSGAWPYLEFIAGVSGIDDPLDHRVVEAYWLGNPLLDRIDLVTVGNALMDRYRRQMGRSWTHLAEVIPSGVVPTHAFHVFQVYPWVGLLGNGRGEPLEVLQKCRIRWGQVVHTGVDQVTVRSRPLRYEDGRVSLGEPALEVVTSGLGGVGPAVALRPGEWVGLHWGWVCDRLTVRQLESLQRLTRRHLTIANDQLAHSGPAVTIG
jgi:hypothetical protein